jgi:hypothetical protein
MTIKIKILLLIALLIIIAGLYEITKKIIIKHKGSQIIATVVHVDTDCDKYNHIQVQFETKVYEVTISRTECRDRAYKIGQQVILIKYKDFDELIWPESKIEMVLFLIITVMGLAYYTNKGKFSKSKDSKNSNKKETTHSV